MIKLSELNKSLGWVLTVSSILSYAYLLNQLPYLNQLGGGLFFVLSIAFIPVLLIGLSNSLTQLRFEKFSSNGFKIGAFFLITLLLYAIWVGPSYWLYTLILGSITGGLLFSLIKLDEALARLFFILAGIVVVVAIIVTGTMFVS